MVSMNKIRKKKRTGKYVEFDVVVGSYHSLVLVVGEYPDC